MMDDARRAKRRKKKREAMLDIAMEILIEHGPDGLTISAMAQSLSLSVGALYRYFDGKESIMVELQKRAIERFHDRMLEDDALAVKWSESEGFDVQTTALLRLVTIMHSYGRDAVRAPQEHHLMQAIMSPQSTLLSVAMALEVDQTIQPTLQLCMATIERAQSVGVFKPGDQLMRTYVVWALLQGTDAFLKRDRFQNAPYTSPFITREAFESTFYGWGADVDLVVIVYDAMAQMFSDTTQ